MSKIEKIGGVLYVNPGSVSIPKEETPRGYVILTENEVIHKDLNGNILKQYSL